MNAFRTTFRRPAAPGPLVSGLRRGFTMIELLVVITIVAILMTLVSIAGVRYITSAKAAKTKATIKKIDDLVQERVAAVNRWHARPVQRLQHDWNLRGWVQLWNYKGQSTFSQSASSNEGRMVLSRKGLLLEMLPTSRNEMMLSYRTYLQPADWASFDANGNGTLDTAPPVNGSPPTEFDNYLAAASDPNTSIGKFFAQFDLPGEPLYYALLHVPVYSGEAMQDEFFKSSELIDADNDGNPEIADAWGGPIRFYRWPTRLVNNRDASGVWSADTSARNKLLPTAPAGTGGGVGDLGVDPDDRAGFLSGNNYLTGTPIVEALHDANTWHTPLIVSAGPDGILGLYEPDDAPNAGNLAAVKPGELENVYDDISNVANNGSL